MYCLILSLHEVKPSLKWSSVQNAGCIHKQPCPLGIENDAPCIRSNYTFSARLIFLIITSFSVWYWSIPRQKCCPIQYAVYKNNAFILADIPCRIDIFSRFHYLLPLYNSCLVIMVIYYNYITILMQFTGLFDVIQPYVIMLYLIGWETCFFFNNIYFLRFSFLWRCICR